MISWKLDKTRTKKLFANKSNTESCWPCYPAWRTTVGHDAMDVEGLLQTLGQTQHDSWLSTNQRTPTHEATPTTQYTRLHTHTYTSLTATFKINLG